MFGKLVKTRSKVTILTVWLRDQLQYGSLLHQSRPLPCETFLNETIAWDPWRICRTTDLVIPSMLKPQKSALDRLDHDNCHYRRFIQLHLFLYHVRSSDIRWSPSPPVLFQHGETKSHPKDERGRKPPLSRSASKLSERAGCSINPQLGEPFQFFWYWSASLHPWLSSVWKSLGPIVQFLHLHLALQRKGEHWNDSKSSDGPRVVCTPLGECG